MKRVLIIDDDQFVLRVYQSKFDNEGFITELAHDATSALHAVAANTPHIVLLDLLMPGMNGVDLLKRLRAQPSMAAVPVIVFSQTYDTALMESARAAGALQCLNKSTVTPNRLMEIVRAALALPSGEGAERPATSGEAALSALQQTQGALRARLATQSALFADQTSGLLRRISEQKNSDDRFVLLTQLQQEFFRISVDAGVVQLAKLGTTARGAVRWLDDLRKQPDGLDSHGLQMLGRLRERLAGLMRDATGATTEDAFLSPVAIFHRQPEIAAKLGEAVRAIGLPAVVFRRLEHVIDVIHVNPVQSVVFSAYGNDMKVGDVARRCTLAPTRPNPAVLFLGDESGEVPKFEEMVAVRAEFIAYPFSCEQVALSVALRHFR